jgi:hypothetical protein
LGIVVAYLGYYKFAQWIGDRPESFIGPCHLEMTDYIGTSLAPVPPSSKLVSSPPAVAREERPWNIK